jgi:hypothetical protein
VVHGIEILAHVELEKMAVALRAVEGAKDGSLRALAAAAGVAVVDLIALEDGMSTFIMA